jgi:creatinine amidohydrolase/Fe(II)-dependent formamide hydrolase-like protein
MRIRETVVTVTALLALAPFHAIAQVRHVAELTADEIRALDRARTAVILPGGVLEQHAGHLPSYSDGFMNQRIAEALARAIAARPGWTALVFPMIPLGSGGANEIGGKYSWPGTYAVRVSTLRAIFMDLATELGDQAFRWVFVVHNHGSPWHNQALDDAGDFFRDTYAGRMVNLGGIEPDWARIGAAGKGLVTPEILAEDADSVHGGLSETSRVMYVRPNLVSSERVKATPSVTTPPAQLVSTATAPGWPGYFGAPRHASAALGKAFTTRRPNRGSASRCKSWTAPTSGG